jgi:ABC-type hemin transport system ATPase subunit
MIRVVCRDFYKEVRACSLLHDLRLKNISNFADTIVKMKAAEITNYNICIVKTKNVKQAVGCR